MDWFLGALESIEDVCSGYVSSGNMQRIQGSKPASFRFLLANPDYPLDITDPHPDVVKVGSVELNFKPVTMVNGFRNSLEVTVVQIKRLHADCRLNPKD